MNKFLLITAFLLILSADFIAAQTDNPFSFGFALTPKTNFVLFEDDNLDEANNKIGGSAQILVHYQRNARWAFVTGIKYSQDRFERTDYSIVFGSDIDPLLGVDLQKSWVVSDVNLHYLGVPVEGRYYFKTTNNRMYTKLGFEYFFKIGLKQTNVIYESGNPLEPFEGEWFDEPKEYGTKASLGVG